MPCLRATMTGDTPCCRLSAAISRFCSAVQRRRRSRPVITSMRRLPMLVRLVVGVSSESNATAITLSSFLKDDRWPNFPRAAQCAAAISLTFSYEREVQPRPKLGRWKAELDQLLTKNAAAAPRERLTLIRIFEDLRALGYDGGYDAVRRYARVWSREHAGQTAAAHVPLSFAPGEAYQFDWSHEVVVMGGVTVTVKVAHVRLCHSRMMFVRAYPRETQEMVFDAHERAFALFKGACTRGIYDNMKTAVEAIFIGKDRQYN